MRFFESWNSLVGTALLGLIAYAALIVILRLTGKRTLSKMNAFDLVVTVAIGSTLASIITSRRTPLADGVLALLMLTMLQFVITWSSVRSRLIRRLVKSEPSFLFYKGAFLDEQLHDTRVVRDEVLAAMRSQGILDLRQVQAVVLETDGSFSVIKTNASPPEQTTLQNVSAKRGECKRV